MVSDARQSVSPQKSPAGIGQLIGADVDVDGECAESAVAAVVERRVVLIGDGRGLAVEYADGEIGLNNQVTGNGTELDGVIGLRQIGDDLAAVMPDLFPGKPPLTVGCRGQQSDGQLASHRRRWCNPHVVQPIRCEYPFANGVIAAVGNVNISRAVCRHAARIIEPRRRAGAIGTSAEERCSPQWCWSASWCPPA